MLGVDLSNNNGTVVWDDLKAAGVDFAICKASEGVHFEDSTFARFRDEAAWVNIRFGAYHYARPDLNSPEDEAGRFAGLLGGIRKNELRPALDLEVPSSASWPRLFLLELERLLGVRPMLYSYPSFLATLMAKVNAEHLRQWPLWLADYGPDDGQIHPIANDFGFRIVCHQFTSDGPIAGMSGVDLNSAESMNDLRDSSDYLAWREWVLDGKPSPKPAGLPSSIPYSWKDAYNDDVQAIFTRDAPLITKVTELTAKIAAAKAALA